MSKHSKPMSHESDAISELSDQSLLAVFGGCAPSSASESSASTPALHANTASGSGDGTDPTKILNKDSTNQTNDDFFGNGGNNNTNGNNTNVNQELGGKGDTSDNTNHTNTNSNTGNHGDYGSSDHNHQSALEAAEHGIYELANGVADLAVAFLESLPHHNSLPGAGLGFGGKGSSRRG
jgi:hypothetical protein